MRRDRRRRARARPPHQRRQQEIRLRRGVPAPRRGAERLRAVEPRRRTNRKGTVPAVRGVVPERGKGRVKERVKEAGNLATRGATPHVRLAEGAANRLLVRRGVNQSGRCRPVLSHRVVVACSAVPCRHVRVRGAVQAVPVVRAVVLRARGLVPQAGNPRATSRAN
jgi:hypothetical protein